MRLKRLFLFLIIFFLFNPNVYALTGVVVGIDPGSSLTFRNGASTSAAGIGSFVNGDRLEILNTNAGLAGCNGGKSPWYQVKYGNTTGYVCSAFVELINENTNNNTNDSTVTNGAAGIDNSYNKDNYSSSLGSDGSVMCYEDTGSITLRDAAGGNKKSGQVVDCGEKVTIIKSKETKGTTCPYWYKINNGKYEGYLCGYFVNTTKLTTNAQDYYNNRTNGDTIDSYKAYLTTQGFPESYHPYLLELHARHPNWSFVKEQINLNFEDVIEGESSSGRNLLQFEAFGEGYTSTAAHTYNILTNQFFEYIDEPGYYNASKEAIAYYLDPRNYLNEKYIFAFESLWFSANQNSAVVSHIISGQTFFNTIYKNTFADSKGSAALDIIEAAKNAGTNGISSVHVEARIKQEMTGVTTSSSRLGGTTTCNGKSVSGYYNFFNIKGSGICDSKYTSYAYDRGWDTPYKGLLGGAKFMYNDYLVLNQDTLYYEKFDVSTNNGNYTHQYMQNLAAAIQEGGIKYKGYVESDYSYLEKNLTFTIPVYNNMPSRTVTAPTLGNPNNYLSSLKVNGTKVANFNYSDYTYSMTLPSNTTSVKIEAAPIVGTSTVEGIGTINITSKEQSVVVKVKAQNGKIRNYTINFTKKDSTPTTVADSLNNSGFKYNNNHIFGINVGTNVSVLINNIRNYNDLTVVEIKSSKGQTKTNDSFRTGDKVSVTASGETKNYEVVIFGDVDGDGEIGRTDLLQVQRDVFNYKKLEGVFSAAGDIDKNGKVDRTDLLQVQRHVFKYADIKQQ